MRFKSEARFNSEALFDVLDARFRMAYMLLDSDCVVSRNYDEY